MRAGYVSQDQVDVALRAAAEQGCRIGTALVRLGYLDSATLARALGKLRRIRWLEPGEVKDIDADLARRLPPQTAHQRRAVPVRWLSQERSRPEILVAFDNPPDVDVLDELSFVLDARITPCITPEDVLDDVLDRLYPTPKPAAYRMVDLEPEVTVGGADRTLEAVLRDCQAALEVHPTGCVLMVDAVQWRGLTARKSITEFVVEYVRRHHDPSGQLTVRGHRERHLLAHFTGIGRPVAATRDPPGAEPGEDDPLFHQRVQARSRPRDSQPALQAAPSTRSSQSVPAVPRSALRSSQSVPAVPRSALRSSQSLPAVPRPTRDLPRATRDLPPGGTRSTGSHPVPPGVSVVAGTPMVRPRDPLRASFDEPPAPPAMPAPLTRPPAPTRRDQVRVTGVQPSALDAAAHPEASPAGAPNGHPAAASVPEAGPKIEVPAFPAPSASILSADPDGLQDSLHRALDSDVPVTPKARPPPLPPPDEEEDEPVSIADLPPARPEGEDEGEDEANALVDEDATPVPQATFPPPEAPAPEAPSASAGSPLEDPAPIDVEAVRAALEQATTPAEVADALVEALAPACEAVLVLVVKHDSALGWRGAARAVDDEVIEAVLIPLSEPSVVARAKDRRRLVVESPDSDEQPVHRRLWRLLRLEAPERVAAAPVVLKERVVNLLYVHPRAEQDLPTEVVERLPELAAAASEAFARLIQVRKSS